MVDSEGTEQAIGKVQMAEARDRLRELTTDVATGKRDGVELCRRNVSAALLVGPRFTAFVRSLHSDRPARDRRKRQLAWLITEQWLGAAPAHLWTPQMAELERLDLKGLFALFSANPTQLATTALVDEGVDETIVERLKKRRRVARAIQEAEEDGLYEIAEHATSEVDLDEADSDG